MPTLHSVFWVTYNWSYKYAYTCAFMHLFLRYAAPNHSENTVKIILTVTGIDHEGIIAAVTATLAERKVNVLDVSQTIMGEFFTMIMHCSFDEEQQNLIDLQEAMVGVEHEQKVQIRIQAESIFKAMHTI